MTRSREAAWALIIGTSTLTTACGGETRGQATTSEGTSAGTGSGGSASGGSASGGSGSGSATGGTATGGSASTSEGDGSASSTATGGDSTSGGDSASDSGGVRFDLGTELDLGSGGQCDAEAGADCGCTAVDILFVVDNSGSMQQHAAAVNAAFDTFVEEMVGAVPSGTSLHVGVTRATGFYDPGNSGGFGTGCEASITDGAWNPPDTGTSNGINGQQGRLFEHDARKFFEMDTSTDSAPLKTWFQGALMGSIDGNAPHSNTETVVAGAAYPFHPVNDAFNAGFLRQNAVLVIFLLSDSSDLSPKIVLTQSYIDMVSNAKAGCGDMCILTTGAIAGGCYDGAGITNNRLYEFMNGFGHPPASYVEFAWNGSPDFTGVLGTALAEVIGTTCEQIPPVG